MYIARVRVAARHRGVYDYSDYHSAARICAAIPAGTVPDVLECVRGGRDRFLDCAALGDTTQRALTLLALPPVQRLFARPAFFQQKSNL
jgi:hypothetical protein